MITTKVPGTIDDMKSMYTPDRDQYLANLITTEFLSKFGPSAPAPTVTGIDSVRVGGRVIAKVNIDGQARPMIGTVQQLPITGGFVRAVVALDYGVTVNVKLSKVEAA